MTKPAPDFPHILQTFDLAGHVAGAETFGNGHINDTYLVRIAHADRRRRYVLQRINADVFPDVEAIMRNLVRIAKHVAERSAVDDGLLDRQVQFAPIPTRDGAAFARDEHGDAWRLIPFIYGAHSIDTVSAPAQAGAAGSAFGRFLALLSDLDPGELAETIPGFHDTPARYRQFEDAVGNDAAGRAADCAREIDMARSFAGRCALLENMRAADELPLRVAHNDAKINNVLFDDESSRPACVVDLDTVMPGTPLHDFGDLVRTAIAPIDEDARRANEIEIDIDCYEALVAGYLAEAGALLNDAEIAHLPDAGLIITIETGLRFLADHLDGDRYFRTTRPGQNLDRCRTQFALASSIERRLDRLHELTEAAHANMPGGGRTA